MTRLSEALDRNHERGGFKCPFCSCDASSVFDTNTGMPGVIRRVRICRQCGRKVPTKEVIDEHDLKRRMAEHPEKYAQEEPDDSE